MSDYDTDTVLWSERQADLLRRLAAGEHVNEQVDWENVAEEIDSVGRSQRTALASHIRVVLEHLMKLDASPAIEPRRGWAETVRRAQLDIKDLLEDSPSLRPSVERTVARLLPDIRDLVADILDQYGEAPRVPLETLSYDADAVLSRSLSPRPRPAD